jgi:hypothetical protein
MAMRNTYVTITAIWTVAEKCYIAYWRVQGNGDFKCPSGAAFIGSVAEELSVEIVIRIGKFKIFPSNFQWGTSICEKPQIAAVQFQTLWEGHRYPGIKKLLKQTCGSEKHVLRIA